MSNVNDRRHGALIGLAVGDALGAAGEFSRPCNYRSGGPHGLAPGEWTDDTSMALALSDSLAVTNWDLFDQAQKYVSWWRQGKYSVNGRCFDVGDVTRAALAKFERSADPFSSGDWPMSGEPIAGHD